MVLEKLFRGENLLILFGVSTVLFLLIFEVGYRIARKRQTSIDEATKAWFTAIYSAILAMLGLLLGFSYSMAQQRFEVRKQLVVEEANAIGTTYLRAAWLPEPYRGDVAKLLRQYVDARLPKDLGSRNNIDELVQNVSVLSERLLDQMWVHAVEVAKTNPTPVVALFLMALNETIDLHAKRLAQFQNRIPNSVLLLLYLFATVAVLMTGFGSGLRTRRLVFPIVAMIVLVSTALYVIVDLERPQGLINVSQESMIRLQQRLIAGSETTPAPMSGQRTK
jgi:uncharacterized membrane protein YsdA (DUF1294 family)